MTSHVRMSIIIIIIVVVVVVVVVAHSVYDHLEKFMGNHLLYP